MSTDRSARLDLPAAFDLSGRVALVTGGSRGLGRAIVRGLADAGADVLVASRDGSACEQYAAEVAAATGRRAVGVSAHVGHWDELPALVDTAYDTFGRVDVLVNNAGMSPLYDDVADISEALFDKVLDVNLKGPFRLATMIGQRMRADGGVGGSIVNISSMAAQRPRPHALPYAAAKAGLNAVTVALAHALGPEVRVNAILAGTFLTDISTSWDAETFARRASTFAAGRGGEPAEIVGMALYLASDASSYTTGSLLAVDGGQP